jgi:NADPH:quinone reductase-like Zn-dependent oxidoreductase
MRVIQFDHFGDPSQLHVVERADPKADESTAVVGVESASVNPSDVKNVAGKMSQTTLPRVPGRDYSGVVVDGPSDWIGAEVWGTGGDVGFTRDGTHARYVVVPRASLVRKPVKLSHDEAGAVGVTFLAAWIGLIEYAGLKQGGTLVVFGSSGGVGGAAMQIARRIGARISSPRPASLKSLRKGSTRAAICRRSSRRHSRSARPETPTRRWLAGRTGASSSSPDCDE